MKQVYDFSQEDSGAQKRAYRGRLGQYLTPAALAEEMAGFALNCLSVDLPIKFLEPGFGHGAFYEATLQLIPRSQLITACGYEVDQSAIIHSRQRWPNHSLILKMEDYTVVDPPSELQDKFNLLLCNPPYVRHQYLETQRKKELQTKVLAETKVNVNGRAGLYCYFLLLAHNWLAPNAIAGWLLPGEFLDADYSAPIREYLLSRVTLLRVHRYETTESIFEDADVSSTIVFYRNSVPEANHRINVTYGGSFSLPKFSENMAISKLRMASRWSNLVEDNANIAPSTHLTGDGRNIRLSDLFRVTRGIATGANDFFILEKKQAEKLGLPDAFLRPVLPSARHLATDIIDADEFGNPTMIPLLYLLDCNMDEDEVRSGYPYLWDYFEAGKKAGIHRRTLCQHRKVWYFQEWRPPAPIVCKYMGNNSRGRDRVFRFFFNKSKATATNAYHVLYPRSELQQLVDSGKIVLGTIVQLLNAYATDAMFLHGRRYGGGKIKIEPRELGNLSAHAFVEMMKDEQNARA